MRKRTILALLLILLTITAFTAPETIVFGADDDWQRIAAKDGIIIGPGRHGYRDVSLMYDQYRVDHATELLLQFDVLPVTDRAGRYTVSAPSAELSRTTYRGGSASLLSDDPLDQITLTPGPESIFRPGIEWGSFTIEFWLYPATLSDGESVFSWSAIEGADHGFREQRIDIGVEDRRLRFDFLNFFMPSDGRSTSITLIGDRGLIPRRWSHHQLRFDETSALLEYQVDGHPVSITHASESRAEDGSIFYPRIARYPGAGLTLIGSFTGAIDDFRIERSFGDDPALTTYPRNGGYLLTTVVDLGSPGATLTAVTSEFRAPGLSDVFLFYRIADWNFADHSDQDAPEWIPVASDQPLSDVSGRYVQIKAELFPDPATPETPRISDIRVEYQPDPPPLPPVALSVRPLDGAVALEWAPSLDPDIQGYLVYYGEQSGRYFGSVSTAGISPVEVGPSNSVILNGLQNGTLYYFAVGAVSRHQIGLQLSREVAARPAKVYQ